MPQIDIISTDGNPTYLNQVSLEIFRMWQEFARGTRQLGGKRLMHPTGKYAAALSMRRYGSRVGARAAGQIPRRVLSHVAIIANEDVAPEAAILETGHRGIDMLQHLEPGQLYPIHREAPDSGFMPQYSMSRSGIRSLYSETRELQMAGYARTPGEGERRGPRNTSGTGPAWYIPPMPMYQPAHILADLFAAAKGLEITVSD